MKKAFIIIGLISVLSLLPTTSIAKPVGGMGGFGEKLGLTDEQKAKMKEIRNSNLSHEARREAIKGILTPEQVAQKEAMRAERQKGQGCGHGHKPSTMPGSI